jgi:putative SOS response-associated peptidase YedK
MDHGQNARRGARSGASGDDEWSPRYNIAPTHPVPVIRQDPKESARRLSLVRWGLIPSWAKDSSAAARMTNARSETAATKPAFRDALRSRRCLIPADGFYQRQRTGKTKQPYCFEVDDGQLFAFAGIWDRWKDASGNAVETCSILTTTPNAVTSPIHDRMPVILDPDTYDLWLDPGMKDACVASELLKPCDARLMRCSESRQDGKNRAKNLGKTWAKNRPPIGSKSGVEVCKSRRINNELD